MKALILPLLFAFSSFQMPMGGITAPGATGCTAPTMTQRWTAYNAANTCTSGCTNGNAVTAVPNLISAVTLTNGGTITYTTPSLNSLASLAFGGSSYMGASAPILTNPSTMSMYFIGKVTNSQINEIFGVSGSGGGPEWRVNASGQQELVKNATALIATGTSAVPNNTYVALAVTYTVGSAWNFYHCTSGTCSTSGSGTSAVAFGATENTNLIGWTNGGTKMIGNIVEIGASTSIMNLTTLGTYAQCQYGL